MSQISTIFGTFAGDKNYKLWEPGGVGQSVRHKVALTNGQVDGRPVVVDDVDIQGASSKETEKLVRELFKRNGFKEVHPA